MPQLHRLPVHQIANRKPLPHLFSAIHRSQNLQIGRRKGGRTRCIACVALASITGFTADHAAAASITTAPSSHPTSYADFITEAAQRFAIPAPWIHAVIEVESAGNALVVSPKGAMGLMQLMPGTWAELRLRYHLGDDPFDTHDNIIGGTAYMRELLDRFGVSGLLVAYNAGPKYFEDYRTGLRPLRDETRRYLSKLARMLPDVPIDGASIGVADAHDWRKAKLFTGPSSSPSLSGAPAHGAAGNGTKAGEGFALAPQHDGLFVPIHLAARP